MNNEIIQIGQDYRCKPVGLKNTIVGEVISKLENCVVMYVKESCCEDAFKVIEKKRRSLHGMMTFWKAPQKKFILHKVCDDSKKTAEFSAVFLLSASDQ